MAELIIGGRSIAPGEQCIVDLPVAPLYTHNNLSMNVHIRRGRRDGPRLLVSAAIHGDELNGVEVIRRLLKHRALQHLRGSLITIPIVNVYGFLNHSRYLPDGRDLNRSFPGSAKGSLTGRIAHTFMNSVLSQCSHGIDIHTGARHRSNLPQIRADLNDPQTRDMATAFGVPVILHAKLRDGSLRQAASDAGIPMLLYEAGEALRFDEMAIRAGVRGIINVMRAIGMLPASRSKRVAIQPMMTDQTLWVRAPVSGVLHALVALGAPTRKGELLGMVADPLGASETEVRAPESGIVIGRTFLPLIHEGEALFHIARYKSRDTARVLSQMEVFQEQLEAPALPYPKAEEPLEEEPLEEDVSVS